RRESAQAQRGQTRSQAAQGGKAGAAQISRTQDRTGHSRALSVTAEIDSGSTKADRSRRKKESQCGERISKLVRAPSGVWRPRIRVRRLEKNRGISFASNVGLEAARGDWMALLDHDDLLEPDALFHTVKLLLQHPDADLIYSDEDKLTETGFDAPFFKPDWSP